MKIKYWMLVALWGGLSLTAAEQWRIVARIEPQKRLISDFESGETEALSSSPDFVKCTFSHGHVGWAAGVGGTVLRTVDGGSTWRIISSDPALYPASLSFVNERDGWLLADKGASQQLIMRTHDGGRSWVIASRPGKAARFAGIGFADEYQGWAVGRVESDDGESGAIWSSADGGRTWRREYLDKDTSELKEIRVLDTKTAWSVGSDVVLSTADGGRTWKRRFRADRIDPQFRHIIVAGASDIWVIGHISLHSADGGSTWQEMRLPQGSVPESMIFVSANHGFAASNSQVWETWDNGRNWRLIDRPPAPITGFCASDTTVVALTSHPGVILAREVALQ